MEIKARLNKPYTDKQRCDFIVEYNHKLGYEIQETAEALLAAYNEPLPPTHEEISALREQFYAKEADKYSCEKIRKTAIGKWTEEDEQRYVNQMTDIQALVEHLYPEDK